MPTPLTRKGARNVTADLDRLATLVQQERVTLDIPEKIANDFALRCDMLSDHIERTAVANAKHASEPDEMSVEEMAETDVQEQVDDDPESDDQNIPETYYTSSRKASPEWAQPAKNETGDSVEPGGSANPHWDANAIGDDRGGPYKQDADEAYMGGEFTQERFHALRDKQQSGQMPKVDGKLAASIARLRKMASATELSGLEDDLKALAERLDVLKGNGINFAPIVANLRKQIAAIGKVRDALIRLEVTGEGDLELPLAADRITRAVSEQVPYLLALQDGVDEGSPTALLEFENMMGEGSLQKLVDIATKIVEVAAKGAGEGTKAKKEASEDKESEDEAEKEGCKKASHGYNLTE